MPPWARRTYGTVPPLPTVVMSPDLKVAADRHRIEQLLTNLLNNALRYGGPNVEIASWRRGSDVELRVRDDGDGVAAERRERIFETFYQGHDHLGVGAGIGLAVCRAVVRARGGTIELEDVPGASFRVLLPGVAL